MGYYNDAFACIPFILSAASKDTSGVWAIVLPAMAGLGGAIVGAVLGPITTAKVGRTAQRDQRRWEKRFEIYPDLLSNLFVTKNMADNVLIEIKTGAVGSFEGKIKYCGEEHFKAYQAFNDLAGKTAVLQSNNFRERVNIIQAIITRIHNEHPGNEVGVPYFKAISTALKPEYAALREQAKQEIGD